MNADCPQVVAVNVGLVEQIPRTVDRALLRCMVFDEVKLPDILCLCLTEHQVSGNDAVLIINNQQCTTIFL